MPGADGKLAKDESVSADDGNRLIGYKLFGNRWIKVFEIAETGARCVRRAHFTPPPVYSLSEFSR